MPRSETPNFVSQFLFEFFGSPVTAFGTFLLGLLLGHYFTLGRDKRKEFNVFAEPVFEALTRQLSSIRHGTPGNSVSVPLELMERYFWTLKRRAFRAAVASYRSALQASNGDYRDGTVTYPPAALAELELSITRLTAFLRPR